MELRMFFAPLLFSLLVLYETVSGRELQLPSDHERLGYDDQGGYVYTTRPLLGVLTVEGDGNHGKLLPAHPQVSYVAASYVKFVESGGARAVPLIYNEPEESLRRKFSMINGIVFTGGDTDLDGGPYLDTAKKLFRWAIEANDMGDYFPIYGVCLGLEVLSVIVAGWNIMDACPANRVAATVQFVNEDAKSKSFFKWIPKDVLDKLEAEPITVENHDWGVKPSTFSSIKSLVDFFDVLTVTPDLNGDMYISAMQGKKYPVTAVMFHPEKNAFEWNYDAIPHSSSAVQLTQSIANYVISEARKSRHGVTSREEEEELVINKYNSIYIGRDPKHSFDEVYQFL